MIAISYKTKQLLDRLGGVEKAIEYLEKNGDFLKLPKVGRATDYHLKEYLKQLVSFGLDASIKISLSPSNPQIYKLVVHYELLKEQYNIRTINILRNLEACISYENSLENKLIFLNTYFFQPYDLLNIRNAGKKTVLELYDLSNKLKEYYSKIDSGRIEGTSYDKPIPEIRNGDSSESENIFFNIKEIQHEYYKQKQRCSGHTIKFLNSIEEEEGADISEKSVYNFFEKYFFGNHDYLSKKNIGPKTAFEIQEIRRQLIKKIEIFAIEDDLDKKLYKKDPLSEYLTFFLKDNELGNLKVLEKFSFQRVACVLLKYAKLSSKARIVLENYFLSTSELSFSEVAFISKCSTETVRTSIKRISDIIIPGIIKTLVPYANNLIVENAELDNSKNIWKISHFDPFNFKGNNYNIHYHINNYLLPYFFEKDYIYLNNTPPLVNGKSLVFDCQDQFYFVTKKITLITDLNGLLNFLETEIHEFESVLFDYNLKILIRRYYQEKELRIDESTNEILFSLISRIKREVIKVDQKRVERNLKKQQNEYVRQMIEDYLRRENQAKRTYHIIELLKSNYIEIETYKLLSQMNKWTQTFSRVGNGLWGLTEWLESKNTKGSIREIVEKLLAQHNNPLHISEIISFLKEFRPITEHSLLSNIKVSENIHFQLFNCSFIGLRNKDYDNYWFKIPRFKASDLRSILKNNKLNYEEQINALINKGYPRIHCEYILQKRYKISE